MANFLFVLRSSDSEKATRCFQFAQIAHSKGHRVDLFLIDSGVDWAVKDRDGSQETTTGDCVSDYLPYLIDNEKHLGISLEPLVSVDGEPVRPGDVYRKVRPARNKALQAEEAWVGEGGKAHRS